MADLIRVSTDDGKYTYVMRDDGRTYALRYGEPWIDNLNSVAGSGMLLAFVQELEDLRAERITA